MSKVTARLCLQKGLRGWEWLRGWVVSMRRPPDPLIARCCCYPTIQLNHLLPPTGNIIVSAFKQKSSLLNIAPHIWKAYVNLQRGKRRHQLKLVSIASSRRYQVVKRPGRDKKEKLNRRKIYFFTLETKNIFYSNTIRIYVVLFWFWMRAK